MKLRKGRVFTSVCQSFCSQGGVCLRACWDTHLRGQTPSPWQTPPPRADTPPRQTPPSRHPPGQTPPWADTPADSHCSESYASYWNAFLFDVSFPSIGSYTLQENRNGNGTMKWPGNGEMGMQPIGPRSRSHLLSLFMCNVYS